jgi:hypothetical protein
MAVAASAAAAGCAAGARWQEPDGWAPTPTPTPLTLVCSHEEGEVDVSPGEPVTVQAFDGTLQTVTPTSNIGEVPGLLAQDGSMWRTLEDLEFSKTYTLTVSGIGADGEAVGETRTFGTLSVAVGFYWNVYLKTSAMYYGVALDGGTFGVGQPIVASSTTRWTGRWPRRR